MGKVIEHCLWLAVPHEELDKARKAAGLLDDGRSALVWDKDAVLWYARPGSDIDRVKAWLPDNTISTGGGDAQAEFHDALTQAGLVVKGLPVMDGKRHRVATLEDKKGQKVAFTVGSSIADPAAGLSITTVLKRRSRSLTGRPAEQKLTPLPGCTFGLQPARHTIMLNGHERPITVGRRRKRRHYTTNFRGPTPPIPIWCERG